MKAEILDWGCRGRFEVRVDVNNKKLNGRIFRSLLFAVGGIGVIAASFLGTLFFLDYKNPGPIDAEGRDLIRAGHAGAIRAALEKYRSIRGTYPVFPYPDVPVSDPNSPGDVPVSDLKKELVDGGYLPAIPADPLWPDKPYHYVSYDGKSYGLLFHLELAKGNISAGGPCLIEVGASVTGWWGQPPNCPF